MVNAFDEYQLIFGLKFALVKFICIGGNPMVEQIGAVRGDNGGMKASRTDPAETAAGDEPERTSRGIQSVEVGGQLLKALAQTGRPMALKDLAREAGMTPAKAHPYLVSFGKLGLIERDGLSGQYGLGSLAVQLGLISLQQVDPVRLAIAELPQLAVAAGCTVSAAVWGASGPVIVRVEEGPSQVNISMRHGMPASLRHTGTGKVFAAFADPATVARALAVQGLESVLRDPAFIAEMADIRSSGVCVVRDELIAGISAMAVPVFDGFGKLVLAIAAIAPTSTMDLSVQGPLARTLRDAGERLSARLGSVRA
jgi:DNA-binding IclR family transcriptional regulator